MNPLTEPQKKWISALRSGKYEQGTFALCKNGKFCCLGVACDLFKEELKLTVEQKQTLDGVKSLNYNSCASAAPLPVARHLNLRHPTGASSSDNDKSLMALNDLGIPFSRIADLLEQQPEKYFNTPCKS